MVPDWRRGGGREGYVLYTRFDSLVKVYGVPIGRSGSGDRSHDATKLEGRGSPFLTKIKIGVGWLGE